MYQLLVGGGPRVSAAFAVKPVGSSGMFDPRTALAKAIALPSSPAQHRTELWLLWFYTYGFNLTGRIFRELFGVCEGGSDVRFTPRLPQCVLLPAGNGDGQKKKIDVVLSWLLLSPGGTFLPLTRRA